ncbi:MAG: two-component system LytT family response regulator [Candidatus Latescibacterota bacterium]|jgi:two-component system LytT family response regulator
MITIPLQNGFEVLEVADIIYCQADDNYTNMHLEKGKKLVSKTQVLLGYPCRKRICTHT